MREFGRIPTGLPASVPAFLWSVVRHYRLAHVSAFVLQTANSIVAVLLPWALSRVIRLVTTVPSGGGDIPQPFIETLLLFFALILAETVLGRARDAIQIRIRPRVRQHVVSTMYRHLQGHSHRFFTEAFAGSLAHRISEASVGVAQMTWTLITELWPALVVLGVSVVLLYGAHTGLGLFFMVWAVAFVAIAFALAAYAESWGRRAAAARSETNGKIVDALSNQQSVRLFSRETHEIDSLQESQEKELALILTANRHTERVRWFQSGFGALLKGGTLWLSIDLWRHGEIGVAELVLSVSLSFLIINEVSNMSRRFSDLFEAFAGIGNALSVIGRPHDTADVCDQTGFPEGCGSIEFRHVGFTYPQGRKVFSALNVTIPAGQRVGLVGYSGGGKSTFVNLLLRQYELQEGSILIGDADICRMSLAALRAHIGYIPQDPGLFHRTVRENIRYGKLQASDAEVELAARRAGAHEFIIELNQGYDSVVGERGVKLSGGQRQRIALARVLLKDAPLVILDEATSSLDALTEEKILEAIDENTVGKTVIVVAHRLSTIAHLDRILVLDQGRIIEDGTHAGLLERNGLYARLWHCRTGEVFPARPD